ncbi:MAG: hypothetical protein K2N51_11840 [Lachnospiraceae bacterium]|nr:hypothetical protein [Lachnospiraceae bacterium]
MSRTTIEVPMKTNNVDAVLDIIVTTLKPSGYEQKIVDGETIWTKGDGVMMKMQCVGITFTENSVLIQGWMKDAITGESSLEGFVAALPKKKLKGLINKIQTTIVSRNL